MIINMYNAMQKKKASVKNNEARFMINWDVGIELYASIE